MLACMSHSCKGFVNGKAPVGLPLAGIADVTGPAADVNMMVSILEVRLRLVRRHSWLSLYAESMR